MENREKEMLEKLKEKSEFIPVPESLEPEQMKKKLEAHDEEKARQKESQKIRSFFSKKQGKAIAGLAAVLAIVCLAWSAFSGRLGAGGAMGDTGSREAALEADDLAWETADDYDTVYEYIQQYKEEMGIDSGAGFFARSTGAVADSAASTAESSKVTGGAAAADAGSSQTSASSADAGAAAYAGDDYSETNVRQEGVDEGDVVKTDGRYLFTLTEENEIAIVDTNGGLQHIGSVSEEEGEIQEFYLAGDKLILVCSAGGVSGSGRYVPDSTKAVTYDISDISQPVREGEASQSGTYYSSRLSGNYLYTFSMFYVDMGVGKEDREWYIPSVDGKLMPEDSLYMPVETGGSQFLVMTAVDVEDSGKLSASRAILAKSGSLYVSNENIYWYEYQSRYSSIGGENGQTLIRKVAYEDGRLEAKAQGIVPGSIKDSFCIDEYGGNLRVVTTSDSGNGLYILDENMEETGRIDKLAKGEQVYSARLLGETGYFVTFRNTDPLFSADLSDPENPRILGELKIPGFSEYLHFYGEDRLLGIGMDADEETGETKGVKLSMFDISNPADVKETDTFIMENVYSTDVFYDYKAALADPDKNIIGFSAYEGDSEKYFVFTYDDQEGFQKQMAETVNGSGWRAARGVYIGEVLYVVKGNIVEAYSMEDYGKMDDLII